MAIHINPGKNDRNATIVKKVESILRHAEFDKNLTIVIEAHQGEIPTIRYNITEDIVPDMVYGKNADKGEEE
jgi:hypothetical protein